MRKILIKNEIIINFVFINDQIVDIFIKSLIKQFFERYKRLMSVYNLY